jgi:hypothetical protein
MRKETYPQNEIKGTLDMMGLVLGEERGAQ